MAALAIIGGTGLARLDGMEIIAREAVSTPFGTPSAPLVRGRLDGNDLVFLARHGDPHRIPPHKINYRANLWALREAGSDRVLAVAAVGGIGDAMGPGKVVIPDQIIDYSYGRAHTFFEDDLAAVTHVDFTRPYSDSMRAEMIAAAKTSGVDVIEGGVYGCTQGPRLESAAEIARMRRDGCDLVGMTGMPEAGLAREAGLDYACCAVVANWGAGIGDGEITMAEIERNLEQGMRSVARILSDFVKR